MRQADYEKFLKEAFIAPLRSVLIVDDDYPTFEEVLTPKASKSKAAIAAAEKAWHKSPERIRGIVQGFRRSKPPLIVDIHDGFNVKSGDETDVADHLHQSDLLVLDYSLDKTDQGDGSRAIEIVRTILQNDHFNLVVLHTSEDLERVFREMLVGILAPEGPWLSEAETDALVERLGPLEDRDEGLLPRLEATLGEEHYIAFRHAKKGAGGWPLRPPAPVPSVERFREIAAEIGFTSQGDQKRLALYLLNRRETAMRGRMMDRPLANLSWSVGERRWIRSDSGFIAFTAKQDEADLLEELLQALADWRPPPSRLFLAKLRARIDVAGVAAESKALGNSAVLAHWYKALLDSDEAAREIRIAESIGRHSDMLMADILPGVSEFAGRLIGADARSGEAVDLCKAYFNIDLGNAGELDKAGVEHNVFVCSKAPELLHLVTGHVFEAEERMWVCLSPMCDLVPGQKTNSSRHGKMKGTMPFIAVRLHELGLSKARDATSNRYFYLRIDDKVRAFTMANKDSDNPHWFNLYATDEGRFNDGAFSYRRVELNDEGELVAKPFDARIVGQLRYEYALNLMNRLGSSMTRVGLDFIGRRDDDDDR